MVKYKKKTQRMAVMEYLQTGHSITSLQAISLFGCTRLSGVIHYLRESHEIRTELLEVKTRYGVATIARYHLVNAKPQPEEHENQISFFDRAPKHLGKFPG